MGTDAARRAELLVQALMEEGVGEAVVDRADERGLFQDPDSGGLLQAGNHALFIEVGNLPQRLQPELPADDRGDGQEPDAVRREVRKAFADEVPQATRDGALSRSLS